MKHLLALLALCLLLCGCAGEAPTTEATLPSAQTTSAPMVGLYDAGSRLEAATQGALRVYPLNLPQVTGMRAMGDGLLVFSGEETTTLTLLTGEELYITASAVLDFPLDPQDPSLRIGAGELSYYDPVRKQTVVLDLGLREVSHIAAPEDLVGSPLLSADRNTLYYCTSNAIRAWDLETGIRRCVKEIAFPEQTVAGLYAGDTVLQCRIREDGKERTLLLSTETGLLVYERDGTMTLSTEGSRYYASFPTGCVQAMLFGSGEEAPLALTPADITASCFFLETLDAAVTVSCDSGLRLEYYSLSSGSRRCDLSLKTEYFPISIEDTIDGRVYALIYDPDYGCETVWRWDVSPNVQDSSSYTGTYYTAGAPDYSGLARCRDYAARIGSKYGIQVLVWEDAVIVQPWDYDFEAEYLVPVIQRELEQLEQRLAQYPASVLEDTASHFTSLSICIVRQLTGTAESGSLDTATGLQFFDGTDAYVVLAAGEYSEHALYHELFHVMETHILNESIAFDQWNTLNPSGFEYDYDYRTNAQRDAGVYLRGETRAFIDTYSMSYPKEDRARIMEYAMLPGNKELFRSEILQNKLLTLCQGIREAYGLKKSEEVYVWEQYLEKPLAYKK
ncbi:MAG: hypothetical protein ACI4PH_10465 [Faecousia sp.]